MDQLNDYNEINLDELEPTKMSLLSTNEQILKLIDVFYYIDNNEIRNDILNRINKLFDDSDAYIICDNDIKVNPKYKDKYNEIL